MNLPVDHTFPLTESDKFMGLETRLGILSYYLRTPRSAPSLFVYCLFIVVFKLFTMENSIHIQKYGKNSIMDLFYIHHLASINNQSYFIYISLIPSHLSLRLF